jgi:cytochrome c peroxidase
VFFHNSSFKSLDEVVRFYVQRDTNPEKWYPKRPDGTVEKYDDLPAVYRRNVDVIDAPFDRKYGDKPALNDSEIADVVEFIKTLNDGFQSTN